MLVLSCDGSIFFRGSREQVAPSLCGPHACINDERLYTEGASAVILCERNYKYCTSGTCKGTWQTLQSPGCKEEHSLDFYPQCFNNPETVTSTVESEHDKTNTMTCAASKLYYQSGHPQSLTSLRRPSEESLDPWLPITRTAKIDQTGRMFRLTLLLSGRTDYLVDFCHAPAYVITSSTLFHSTEKPQNTFIQKDFLL